MAAQVRQIDELLVLVERGLLDELTPAEVDVLERAAGGDPWIAHQLADLRATGPVLADEPLPPDQAQWAEVWRNVAVRSTPRSGGQWWFNSVAAVAAGLLFAVWLGAGNTTEARWALRPDRQLEVLEVETFGDEMPLVMTVGEGDGFPVIWVMDESEGA